METFVAVLGASGLTYAEGSVSQEKEELIRSRSNERAFWYFGGAGDAIVPDNLKSGINRADRYEPEINPDFAEFAEYYSTVIIPALVREARDKALVENVVKLVYQRIYAPLRNRTFYIDDLGLEPFDAPSRLSLLEIPKDRLRRKSSIIVSRIPINRWYEIIGYPTIADAICDRIVHSAHRIELKGESVRKLYARREIMQERKSE